MAFLWCWMDLWIYFAQECVTWTLALCNMTEEERILLQRSWALKNSLGPQFIQNLNVAFRNCQPSAQQSGRIMKIATFEQCDTYRGKFKAANIVPEEREEPDAASGRTSRNHCTNIHQERTACQERGMRAAFPHIKHLKPTLLSERLIQEGSIFEQRKR